MAMENKRITQLSTERLNLTSGDYVMVDDADNGSAKYRLDRLKETDSTLSVSGKAADAAATGQAISDEEEARDNADTALGEDISDLKSATSENRSAIIYGAYIPLMGKLTLLDGKLWTGSVGNSIGTDSWAGAMVRSDALQSFGTYKAYISLSNNVRVKIFEVDTDGTTIRRDTGWLTSASSYTFNSLYTYAFNFSKAGLASITSADVRANCFINAETKINELINSVDLYDKAITQIKPSWITGYYLSGNSSTYNANDSFMYSSPFYIAGHCTLNIFAKGYNTVVNILSKTSAKGGYYKEVKRCVDSSASWYSVDIDEAGYYTVCSNIDTNPIIFVTNTSQSSNSNMLAMFNKLICCGDSLTYGLVYTSSSTYRQARVPYNEALQKMTGVPTVRYATAGYTPKDWWLANSSHLNEDGLYIIFLGTNGGLTDTINEDCAGNDPSQFADTQTGYYGRILRTLEINKKTAVLIKPPSVNAETQGTIQKFADKYGFAAISIPPDLDNSYYHYAPHNINYSNSVHYNDYGYVRIANCIVEAINNLPFRELFLIAPYELT